MPKNPKAKVTTKTGKPRKAAAGSGIKSHQVWPAGFEALAKAQQEGAKVFESLLKQGQRLERKTKEAAADTAAAARGAAGKVREVHQLAGGTWDKLEQVFEDRVARALSKLGLYTQNDIQRLADRVDELSEAVNRLLAAKGIAPKSPARGAKRARKTVRRSPG